MPRTASLPIFLEDAAAGPCRIRSIAAFASPFSMGSSAAIGACLRLVRWRPSSACRAPPRCWRSSNCAPKATSSRGAARGCSSRRSCPSGGRASVRRHCGILVSRPPFSRRGAHLARMRAPDRRKASSAPCAFRLGTPALDLFPLRLWAQLTRECLRALKPSHLDYSQLAGLRQLARGHRRAGAVARHALRCRSDAGRHGRATRPRPDRTHVARSR